MNYSIETAFGKVMVKTEDDIEGQECRLYIREKNVFAFGEDGNRIPVTEEIKKGFGTGGERGVEYGG